jgi:hypothetical protein
MTCIIGLVDKGNVYIGGDSAGISGNDITIRTDEKVFVNGEFLIGFTSSFRMGQLLRYKFAPKPQAEDQKDDMAYMVGSFIDDCRACFKTNSYGTDSKGGDFLVGYRGGLYHIGSDFQVGKSKLPFDAAGCGTDVALGSMFAAKSVAPAKRINLALEAASTFNTGVAGPFLVMKQEKAKKKKRK